MNKKRVSQFAIIASTFLTAPAWAGAEITINNNNRGEAICFCVRAYAALKGTLDGRYACAAQNDYAKSKIRGGGAAGKIKVAAFDTYACKDRSRKNHIATRIVNAPAALNYAASIETKDGKKRIKLEPY